MNRVGSPFYLANLNGNTALQYSMQVLSVGQDDTHMNEKHPPDVLN